jgi:PAS domain S-box-containing protein
MEKLSKANNLPKIKLLRNIIIVSLSIVTLLSLYNVFFIYPSFTELLIESTKKDSIRATHHLASMLFTKQSELTEEVFDVAFVTEIKKIKRDLDLMKLKVFSRKGETLFSTDSRDVGLINSEGFFHDVVAKGNVLAELVPKDTESLEGQKVTIDVVETYVPLMNDDNFLGAFEIYYDITDRKKEFDNLLSRSTILLFTLTIGLLFAFIVIFFKESKTTSEQKRADKALSESEEKLAGILNSIPDMIIVLDEEMNIIWSNHIAIEWLGSEPVGKKCFEAFKVGNKPCEACKVQKSFEEGLDDEHEFELIKPDGSRMNLWCTASVATRSEDGRPKSVIVVYREITEKKLLEAETARAGQLASIGELAAGVAHEINNPINGIINCAQMLMDEEGASNNQAEISQRILKAGDRIAMIVRNLLSFSRDHDEDPELIHIQKILSDSMDLTEAQMRNDGINLQVDIPDDIPMIKARFYQMQQVFLNIISNARYSLNQKFSHADDNKILQIRGETMNSGGNKYVQLVFHDHGIGISDDIVNRICDPFFSNKPLGEGTGLGLSISHAIIKDHGGSIYFNSVEGEYAKVILNLPVAMEE